MKWTSLVIAPLLLAGVWAQEAGDLSPRALFYRADGGAAQNAGKKSEPKKTVPVTNASRVKKMEPPAPPETAVTIRPVAQTLGLRYNLLLVDPETAKARPVSSERTFRSGECVALELQSNEAGFLYMLQKGSSGNWSPLMPSPELVGESNRIEARKTVRMPEQHCFRFDETPGTERLFVVLARKAEQMERLNDAIRGKAKTETPAPQQPNLLMASAALNQQVETLRTSLQSRDLKIQRVAQPVSSNEPAHSVYVVNVGHGTGPGSTADRVVTEIVLEHR